MALAITGCSVTMYTGRFPHPRAPRLFPICAASAQALSELPTSPSVAPIALRGKLVTTMQMTTLVACVRCRGGAETIGYSTHFACAYDDAICCNTIDGNLALRVGKILVAVPLRYSRRDCEMRDVRHELAEPAIVTGVLRTEHDDKGQVTYAMTVSDVCTVSP